jgi:threonine/homoserine/homoserine lactone efflux protein
MTLAAWLTIWALHVAALVTPGANVLLVSHLGATAGRRSASWAAVGVCIGTVVWAAAAALGVNALFALVPAARRVLQAAGAMYLLYIAWRLWRGAGAAAPEPLAVGAGRAIRLGVLTNLSNPKSALFFGSVFSAALPPHPGPGVLAGAVAMVVLNAMVFHLTLAVVTSGARVRAGYAAQRNLLGRAASAIVGSLGLALLVASLREARR